MVAQYLFLLLPVAAGSGWYFGTRWQAGINSSKTARLRRDYFVGLNYLINEQPDKAVDVFIKLLEVDSDTIETHLALGNLFRRRGEVDRAIRVHQNLIARSQLGKQHRVHALSELGQDYMRAGVLDRAERLFLELVEMSELKKSSLENLLKIYQQEKDWEKAIYTAQKLAAVTNRTMQTPIAHYYCELAEQNLNDGNYNEAANNLRRALSIDKKSVRANLLSGRLEERAGRYKQAIRAYRQVRLQDPDFIAETINPLSRCYAKLDDESEYIYYLQDCMVTHPRISVALALSESLQKWQGDRVAIEFLAEHIRHNPSLRALNRLIHLYVTISEGDTKDKLKILNDLIEKLLINKPVYRCSECGVSVKTIYWLCPGCKNWSTIRPIHGLEGD